MGSTCSKRKGHVSAPSELPCLGQISSWGSASQWHPGRNTCGSIYEAVGRGTCKKRVPRDSESPEPRCGSGLLDHLPRGHLDTFSLL